MLMHYPSPLPFIQPSLLLEIIWKTISGAFKIRADLTYTHFSELCGFSNFPSWQHWGIIRFRQLGVALCRGVPEGYVVSLRSNTPAMLQPSEDWVDGGRRIFFHLQIQFQDNLLKFWVNIQENFLEIQKKNSNWKKVEKIFRKFLVNFILGLKKFKIKFDKFWNKLLKDWHICK